MHYYAVKKTSLSFESYFSRKFSILVYLHLKLAPIKKGNVVEELRARLNKLEANNKEIQAKIKTVPKNNHKEHNDLKKKVIKMEILLS